MIGFFRAFSGGVGDAYLLDLIVDPNFRKLGVAGRLVEAVLATLPNNKSAAAVREEIAWRLEY